MKVGWIVGLLKALSGFCDNNGEGGIDGVTISKSVGFLKFEMGEGEE